MVFLLVFILLLFSYLGYARIARYYSITDKPNIRSSHSFETIRGGGILFPLAAMLWFFLFDFQNSLVILSLLLIAVVSFLDDVYTLSRSLRMFVHFFAVTILFWELSLFDYEWFYWVACYIIFVGWINAFNFMDGINGITPFYSLVSLVSFFFVSWGYSYYPADLLVVLSISVLIFTYFNARNRARAFAGDVGSVSMAFLLGWIMLSLILKTNRFEYLLFFSVYGVDSVLTIIKRLIGRENIFKAHRSHLYQYLANETGIKHVTVSIIYAGLQTTINILTIYLLKNDLMNLYVFTTLVLSLSLIYLLIRSRIEKLINREHFT